MAENQDYLIYDSLQEYLQDYLNQIFLIDCLVKMSQQIVQNERLVRKAIEESNSFINADAWINCAKTALTKFDKHYTPESELKQEIQQTTSDQPLVDSSTLNG